MSKLHQLWPMIQNIRKSLTENCRELGFGSSLYLVAKGGLVLGTQSFWPTSPSQTEPPWLWSLRGLEVWRATWSRLGGWCRVFQSGTPKVLGILLHCLIYDICVLFFFKGVECPRMSKSQADGEGFRRRSATIKQGFSFGVQMIQFRRCTLQSRISREQIYLAPERGVLEDQGLVFVGT